MKSLELLAGSSKSDIECALVDLILTEVQKEAVEKSVMLPTVRNYKFPSGSGIKVRIPKIAKFTHISEEVAEFGSVAENTVSITCTTLDFTKTGMKVEVSTEMLNATGLPLISHAVSEVGRKFAEWEDSRILTTLLDRTLATGETVDVASADGMTITLDEDYILVPPATIGGIDVTYCDAIDHKVVCASSIATGSTIANYYHAAFAASTNLRTPTTYNSISIQDVSELVDLIRVQKWEADFLVMHPSDVATLRISERFIDASQYGSAKVRLTGELGTLFNTRVLVTTGIDRGAILCVASKRPAGWRVVKRPIDMKRWDRADRDSTQLYFYYETGYDQYDELAIAVSFGHSVNNGVTPKDL